MSRFRLAVASLLLVSCTAQGPSDFPIQRNLQWFSYVAGEDIRRSCAAGGPDQWRFIYNGIYDEQVRMYDLALDQGSGGGAILQARVKGNGEIRDFFPFDPFGPWRGPFAQKYLTPDQKRDLDQAAVAAGLETLTKPWTRLRSDNFYWIAAACREGTFNYHAWQQPENDLNRLPFIPILLAYDQTPVPYNQPRKLFLGPFVASGTVGRDNPVTNFEILIGSNGLPR